MWEQGWMGTFVNTLLTLENSSGSFPDVAKANPLCSPPVRCWSHLSITWGLMLPRCSHSVSSLFTCLAIDHFPLSLHLHWKVGYRGETKAKFKQINCIVCRRQQVCYFHYQQCSCNAALSYILLPQAQTPTTLLPIWEPFQQTVRQSSELQEETSLQNVLRMFCR